MSTTAAFSIDNVRRVEAKVLPRAGSKTPGDIQRAAARAVLRPDAGEHQ